MKRTKLKPISSRQRKIQETWSKITNERLNLLKEIFGYPLCEWCGRPGFEGHELGGHHLVKRRFGVHTSEVCFIAGWTCHDYLERHPVKEVKQFCFGGTPRSLRKKLLGKLESYRRVNEQRD